MRYCYLFIYLFIYLSICVLIYLFIHSLIHSFIHARKITFCSKITSDPDCVIQIFHCLNRSGLTMALGSTKPVTEMSTRIISWGVKAAGA